MKNQIVVKDNALINASYNLELTEQRLILLSIVRARETGEGITAESKLRIHAGDYMCVYDVDKHAAYKALKEAANNLFERQFSFKEVDEDTGIIGVVRSRWVSRIKYVDDLATLEITFSPDVVPLVTRLEEKFTSYQIKQVAQLSSKYAIRIYELLIAWRSIGKCYFELEDFRFKLGIGVDEYKLMHQFKSRVLDVAIKQINELTDIFVKYEQRKNGRSIVGFDFNFNVKDQQKQVMQNTKDQNTPDLFFNMTESQLNIFSSKLAYLSELGDLAEGNEGYPELTQRIRRMLIDPEQQKQFKPHLEKLGFKPKYIS